MNIKHIIISRLWFTDKVLMEKYLAVAKKVLVPALQAQTCKDFEFGIILNNEDISHVKKTLGIEFTAFNSMEAYKDAALKGGYTIQTRHDIDDWMSGNYVEKIQETYKKENFKTLVVHADPVKLSYPGGQESPMRPYNAKCTSMFLSLCQKEVKYDVFEKQHGLMHSLADKVIRLPKGYAKWVQHPDSVSNTRDKVIKEKKLSGPDNVIHVWMDRPPRPTDEVKVKYVNGKIKTHTRRYADDLVKKNIAKIIEDKRGQKIAIPQAPATIIHKSRAVINYDKNYKIGVIIVCYNTPELITKAINSVVTAKGVRVVIVNNSPAGSECFKTCDKLSAYTNVDVIHTGKNIFHGPALHKGLESLNTEYACVMDSDTVVKNKDVFDTCIEILRDRTIYAVGGSVEHVGHGNKLYQGHAFDYLRPWFGMFRLENYYKFSPFVHHGSPWCQSMIDIKGLMRVVQIPDAGKYVQHKSGGTHSIAKGKWLKGWHAPVIKKNINVTMICFVYNEMLYLPHVVSFWRNQGVNIYVIDNMSTDGTWEWLQKEKIPSHRFDTKEMFHLGWLQAEVTKTLHKIRPDWVIYGAADLYYGFKEPIRNVINKAERQGFNQVKTDCWFAVNTGEERRLPLMENYFWHKPFVKITMISKYDKGIKFAGDHISIPHRKVLNEDGIVINYGSCKTKAEQELKLKRRQKAWDAGMTKTYGSHYRSGKAINWVYGKEKLIDIRKSGKYQYYKNMFSYCNQDRAYFSKSTSFFKEQFLHKYNLAECNGVTDDRVFIFGMYDQQDYEFLQKCRNPVVIWRGTDATRITKERLGILKSVPARHISPGVFVSDDLKKHDISHDVIPVTPTNGDVSVHERGENIYCYVGNEKLRQNYGYSVAKEVEKRTGIKVIFAYKNSYTKEQLKEVYKSCFMGLRLTKHDGLPNTVLELGLMGRRSVYNGRILGSIPWKEIDDICESVKNEYARKGEDNTCISEDIKKYIDTGTYLLKN